MIKHKLPTIFIGIAAVSSLISQSLLDLFSILSLIMVLWIGFEKKMFKELFQKIGIEWAFIGFFITCFIGIVWNTGGFYWEHLKPLVKFNWMIHIYFMIAAFKLWMPKAEDALKLLLGLSLIPSVYAIATKIAGYDFLTPERKWEGRVFGLVNSPTYHAHASTILFVFSICLLFYFLKRHQLRQWIYISLAAVLGLSIYFSYTKGALLAIVVALTLMFAFHSLKSTVIILLFTAVSVFSAFKLDPLLQERVGQTADSGRISLFKAHLNSFTDRPFFGLGYDVYKESSIALEYSKKHGVPESLQTSHAHNQYLQMLSSTGIMGFSFFLCILVFFLWQTWKMIQITPQKSEKRILATTLFFTQISILILFVTDQSFEYAKIRFLILAVWAMAIGCKMSATNKAKI